MVLDFGLHAQFPVITLMPKAQLAAQRKRDKAKKLRKMKRIKRRQQQQQQQQQQQ